MTYIDFYQYPRGNNDGGKLGIDVCPTITKNFGRQSFSYDE